GRRLCVWGDEGAPRPGTGAGGLLDWLRQARLSGWGQGHDGAVPPLTGTAPPVTRICRAAAGLVTMTLSPSSLGPDSNAPSGEKVTLMGALVAMMSVLAKV